MLPQNDIDFLAERIGSDSYSVNSEANMTCVVINEFPLPQGFDGKKSDLLIRLKVGYPDIAPDMWWFDPPARRADGNPIQATQVIEQHLGRSWQRWSRHFNTGQWRSGIDGLESFIALIKNELNKSV